MNAPLEKCDAGDETGAQSVGRRGSGENARHSAGRADVAGGDALRLPPERVRRVHDAEHVAGAERETRLAARQLLVVYRRVAELRAHEEWASRVPIRRRRRRHRVSRLRVRVRGRLRSWSVSDRGAGGRSGGADADQRAAVGVEAGREAHGELEGTRVVRRTAG